MKSGSTREAGRLTGKKILLGVSGSIAAYKAVYLCRMLVKEGAEVRVLMTPAATHFVSPVTFATLSNNPVHTSISDDNQWNDHVEWGLWADLLLIAPATANTMAKMASGMADNMLLATYLSARCKTMIAPAMDLDMWSHPSTKENLNKLLERQVDLIDVVDGELASGLVGPGRMAEPEDILEYLAVFLDEEKTLQGKTVLITAGPTREAIDPVRFISNHSSGKMGIALAMAFANKGANVYLIHGPLNQRPIRHTKIKTIEVGSAIEMFEACKSIHESVDIAVFSAAVSDYAPITTSLQKIKKDSADELVIRLKKNPDIAMELGKIKGNRLHIGFALETEQELENARKKLSGKNFDLVVLNSLRDEGAGFGHETNKVTLVEQNNVTELELKPKTLVALDIVNYTVKKL